MGKRSRDKGKRGEREAAKALSDLTGISWRRAVGQSASGSDAPDVERADDVSLLWIEVKRGKQPAIRPALRQAIRACKARYVPVVLSRADQDDWIVTLRLSDVPKFVREWFVELGEGYLGKTKED